jgi:beta-phosphoglucomutase
VNYKAVLFDFNGIIADDEVLHEAAFHAVLELNGQNLTHIEYLQHFAGRTDRDGWANYLSTMDNQSEDVTRLCQKKREYYQQFAGECIYIYPEVEEVLFRIKALGIRIGLITGASRVEVDTILANLGAVAGFEVIVSADDPVAGKPSPDGYLLGAARLSIPPKECIVVEDTPAGIRAAKRAGMFCVAVTTTHPKRELTEADLIVDSLGEIDWPSLCLGIATRERQAA